MCLNKKKNITIKQKKKKRKYARNRANSAYTHGVHRLPWQATNNIKKSEHVYIGALVSDRLCGIHPVKVFARMSLYMCMRVYTSVCVCVL